MAVMPEVCSIPPPERLSRLIRYNIRFEQRKKEKAKELLRKKKTKKRP
jgi:hypothetical protein